jgi:glycosyltransferase involved in cell wall biosynthesis
MNEQNPINVLHFCNEPVRGGAEEHMLLLLRKLDRRRFRPQLVCPPKLVEQFGSDVPSDVEVVPLSFTSPIQAVAAARFARILRQRRVEVVHSHMFRASLAALPIARFCRVPVTVETAHVREHWRKGRIKSSFFVDRLAGRFVSAYIAVSKATGRYLMEEKCLPKRKVTVVCNGCDVTTFQPHHPVPMGLKGSLGFNEEDRVLVVAARLEPQKGHRVLLDALPAVVREFPAVKLVCVGDGQLRGELEEQSRALGLNASVRFVGYQSNVRDWLALAEFTVLPSFYEGLPLTAIESLAAGRTVIATAVDGTAEVVVDHKTGLTVPPGNATLLTKAITYLLKHVELRTTLAAAGRQWVVDNFSQEQQVRRTEDVYLSALERCRHRAGPLLHPEIGLRDPNAP